MEMAAERIGERVDAGDRRIVERPPGIIGAEQHVAARASGRSGRAPAAQMLAPSSRSASLREHVRHRIVVGLVEV